MIHWNFWELWEVIKKRKIGGVILCKSDFAIFSKKAEINFTKK